MTWNRIGHAVNRRPRISPLAYVLIAFVVSRVIYFVLGIRFDMEPLGHYWQYIDPELLRTNLFESLYYLHSQPPLFNLFLGIVLKIFPGYETIAFQIIFIACGLILSVSLCLLMTSMGISSRLSCILTIIFIASPTCVLYENYLFYTYPVAAVLSLSALMLHRYLKFGRVWNLVVFFALLASLVFTRSFFHLVWYGVMALPIIWFQRRNWRKIVLVAGIPFLLCFILYAKNAHEFGSFSGSSWFGMNFARLTTWRLPLEEQLDLVERQKISDLSVIKPFRKLEIYQHYSDYPLAELTGIPVLDQKRKSTGATNMNNLTYISISGDYWRDARYVLFHYPGTYIGSLSESFFTYFIPSSSYSFLKDNRQKISLVDRAYNLVLCGQLQYEKEITDVRAFLSIGLFTVLGYIVVMIYSLLLLRQAFRRKPISYPFALTLLFIWLNLLYVTIVGNAFELGENNRFRFIAEPLFVVLLGQVIRHKFSKPMV
ncbi:MAG: hypothetical protein GY841_03130 [FCB group bacterium]|nr:hypothetical protein [FCB group bacterium]